MLINTKKKVPTKKVEHIVIIKYNKVPKDSVLYSFLKILLKSIAENKKAITIKTTEYTTNAIIGLTKNNCIVDDNIIKF